MTAKKQQSHVSQYKNLTLHHCIVLTSLDLLSCTLLFRSSTTSLNLKLLFFYNVTFSN